jgi:hypothetical protein
MKKLCECGCGRVVKKKTYWPFTDNRFLSGHNSLGRKCSEETKRKIGKANKGNNWNLGRRHTEESKKKMSVALKGYKVSEETKEKLSFINRGKKLSEETKRKIGESVKGRRHSEESRKKMSRTKKGKMRSQEATTKGIITKLEKRQKSGVMLTAKGYCNVWYDKEYVNDLRKSACEYCGITNMMSIHLSGSKLCTHHKNGKENCAPEDIQTLCRRCHMIIHSTLRWKEIKFNG